MTLYLFKCYIHIRAFHLNSLFTLLSFGILSFLFRSEFTLYCKKKEKYRVKVLKKNLVNKYTV